ncbi:MAG: alkane 1-monooxygenase [Enterobacterales bacterium]|nr:alkane 1-monooxygenase [Enterobacterales bacterium]
MIKYIKYSFFHIMGLFAAVVILLGGSFITSGLIITLIIFIGGDLLLGDDHSTPDFSHPQLLTWQLWLAFPLLCFIVFAAVWQFAETDLFTFGQWVQNQLAIDILSSRGHSSRVEFVLCIFLTGFYIGLIGTITAHELTHRTADPISLLIGRWLLAFSFDTSFSVEHVYGHHRYVSTIDDPATAPRGRNVYAHILISTYKGNVSAWKIEKKRLQKNNRTVFSIHNRLLRGYSMSIVLFAAIYWLAGATSLILLAAAGLWGKSLLEIVNYMEHYGIVRDPKTRVEPRHSWNSTKRVSSWAMFNLTRHSHHHAKASVPFHELQPMANSPEMISGYLGTVLVAMIPPLWHKLMTPKVLDWDKNYASREEQKLIDVANQKSGLDAFSQKAVLP